MGGRLRGGRWGGRGGSASFRPSVRSQEPPQHLSLIVGHSAIVGAADLDPEGSRFESTGCHLTAEHGIAPFTPILACIGCPLLAETCHNDK